MSRVRVTSLALAAALALSLVVSGSALARAIDPARSSIGNSGRLNASATAVHLDGIVYCASCRSFTLGATVSQSGSGAVGQGGVRCLCRGARVRWLLTARAREATRFKPGAARVCVWIIARASGGKAIDAEQWCEHVTLRAAEA
ncbi:MAG: hypothetical protein M3Q31_05990 [Actinomycetota bacterium]|nr:hypothetical protein [Actinomycetota bacterium]